MFVQIKYPMKGKCAQTILDRLFTEHSPLGDLSPYDLSPVLQVWIKLLHYTQINNFFSSLVKSNLVKLEYSCTVILPRVLSGLF